MALEKAKIIPEGGEPISVLFNPTQYSLDRGNQIAEVGIPGLGAPVLQFVRGTPRILNVELFFDTYEQQLDVRVLTDRIYKLLGIESASHVPPICTFQWGMFTFKCVVERVGGRFTLFLSDGRPVRATLTVVLKEYIPVDVLVKETPLESADRTKTRAVKRGDTLASIAAAEYDDPTKWRPIAEANRIENPRLVQPGQGLVIPPLA